VEDESRRKVRDGNRDEERHRGNASRRYRNRRRRRRRRRSIRAIGDSDNPEAIGSGASRTTAAIIVIVVVIIDDTIDDGSDVSMAVAAAAAAAAAAAVIAVEAKANSMMRRWRRRGLFLGGVHGTRGQELAHILRIMCLFVGLEYRRPREGLATQRTPEWPLASVHAAMVLHVVAQLKRLAAELALERSVSGMRR